MEQLATEGARQLFSQGVLGVFVVVLAVIAILLYRELKDCQEGRLTDTRALIKAVEDSTKAIGAFTLSLESNNRVMEARTRATEAVAATVEALKLQTHHADDRLREKVEALHDVVERLRSSGGGS